MQIGSCSGYVELTVKLKQNEAFPGPKVRIGGGSGGAGSVLPPRMLSSVYPPCGKMGVVEWEKLLPSWQLEKLRLREVRLWAGSHSRLVRELSLAAGFLPLRERAAAWFSGFGWQV